MPDTGRDRKLPAKAGLNRYVWNFRLPDATLVEDAVLWGIARGPKVPPGQYQVRLNRGDWSQTQDIEVLMDPRLETSAEDLQQQYELARAIWESLSESHDALGRIREIQSQTSALAERLLKAGREEQIDEAVERLSAKLTSIEQQIYQTRSESGQDILNFPPKLDNQFLDLQGIVESADAGPTLGAVERYAELQFELETILAELDAVMDTDLAELNQILERVPAIVVPGG